MSEARRLTLGGGEILVLPPGLDDVLSTWLIPSDGPISDVTDDLVALLYDNGFIIAPLAFNKSTQAVELNVYTQALFWKREAERRAAAAEDEVAELQALFVAAGRFEHALCLIENHRRPFTRQDMAIRNYDQARPIQ